MEITFITNPELLARKFAIAAQMLEPVVKEAAKGEFTVDDLYELNLQGKAITTLIEKDGNPAMAMVFEFVHYPQMMAVNIMALGGGYLDESIAEFWEQFKQWCKDAGAVAIEASCSPGMTRLLSKYGFKPTYQLVRTEL
jgi:hypothetical protein